MLVFEQQLLLVVALSAVSAAGLSSRLLFTRSRIANAASGKCWATREETAFGMQGTYLSLEYCDSRAGEVENFLWSYTEPGLLQHMKSGKCVGAIDKNLNRRISMTECTGTAINFWRVSKVEWNTLYWSTSMQRGDVLYHIPAVKPPNPWQICIDTIGIDGLGGIVNWPCDPYMDQKYRIEYVPEPTTPTTTTTTTTTTTQMQSTTTKMQMTTAETSTVDTTATDLITVQTPTPVPDSNRKKLFILAEFRSGSTFISELFNQHPKGMYLFEPAIMMANTNVQGWDNNEKLHLDLWNKLLREYYDTCAVPNPKHYITKGLIDHQPSKGRRNILNQCIRYGICFKTKHNWLKGKRGFRRVDQVQSTEICRESTVQSMKTIRVESFAMLKPTMINRPEIKIIYLTRDPRGMYNSRRRFGVKNVTSLCNRYRQNYEYIKDPVLRQWLTGRVIPVRYEDLAWNATYRMKQLYKFVDIEENAAVNKWIEENTKNSTGAHYFNTKRDSRKVLQSWRSKLKWETVDKIQQNCADMMQVFGYQTLTQENFRNTSVNFFDVNWTYQAEPVLRLLNSDHTGTKQKIGETWWKS